MVITYLVSAKHIVPSYAFDREPVKVYETTGNKGSTVFYALHPKLGCGKNYSTTHSAIYALFQDHACTSIHIHGRLD